jgi:hypothetical protein
MASMPPAWCDKSDSHRFETTDKLMRAVNKALRRAGGTKVGVLHWAIS